VQEQREHPDLAAGHPAQLAQRGEVERGIQPLAVGEQQVRAEHQVEGAVRERQVGQRAGPVPVRAGHDVAREPAGGLAALGEVVVGRGEEAEDEPAGPDGVAQEVVAARRVPPGPLRQRRCRLGSRPPRSGPVSANIARYSANERELNSVSPMSAPSRAGPGFATAAV
jgi:hypothetical protein